MEFLFEYPIAHFSWEESLFFDWWVFVHIMWGFILGYGLYRYRFYKPVLLGLTLFIVYELFEYRVLGVHENSINILMDIIFGLLGMIWFGKAFFDQEEKTSMSHILAIVFVIGTIVLTYVGWSAYSLRTGFV